MALTKKSDMATALALWEIHWFNLLRYEHTKPTLADHLQDCFGFIPARKIWAFLTSEEVEVCALLAIATGLLMGLHISIMGH